MKLQQRLVLTLCAIAVILVAPALYGISALTQLRQVATDLSTRDAAGALALGRLQTAYGDVEAAERIYVALAGRSAAERDTARRQLAEAITRVPAELDSLTRAGYRDETARAAAAWRHLREQIGEEQRLIEAGQVELADQHRPAQVDPAFGAMSRSLVAIRSAIDARSGEQLVRAGQIADVATTTTRLALAAALGLALVVSAWLARNLLLPIRQLRLGMAEVAEGDFQPEAQIPAARPDELGDLARSFTRMTQQLLALDRLKAEFVSIASHELKTPLSVIRGYVSLLREGIYGPVPEQQDKILASVEDQADRLGRLIKQLLDVSRFEAGGGRLEIRAIDIRAFLQELATSFEPLALQNAIDFRLELGDPLPETLQGDPDRLNEVLGNLLSNAFKFTPRDGQIRLCARPGARKEDEGVLVEVADTGVGIPEDQLPRIFEKFYQVDNDAQPRSAGSGLGLAIAREIVEAHGGTISAESTVGSGTTFFVFLPTHPPSPGPA